MLFITVLTGVLVLCRLCYLWGGQDERQKNKSSYALRQEDAE